MSNAQEWRVAGASVIGSSHEKEGLECQDRFRWSLFEDGRVIVAVVADGAGSTEFGGLGAELACETFIEQLENYTKASEFSGFDSLNADFGTLWVDHYQHLIINKATTEEIDVREYSSTFSAAVITPAKAKFYQIGDGRILYSDGSGFEYGIDIPESEYVNMTHFLTDEDAADQIYFFETEDKVKDLVLFTDGIENIAIDFASGKPYEPFLLPMLAPLRNGSTNSGLSEKLFEFLSSPAINEKTDDDKTLILASR